MKKCLALLIILPLLSFSQLERKTLEAVKINEPLKIDGTLDEVAWSKAPVASYFVMFEPENGPAAPKDKKTEVKILYSDEGLYIGAKLYDNSPDSILRQLTPRDDFNQNTDWFGFFINPYNDGLNDFNFWVTAAGVQADSRTTADGDDFSWNAIWESAISINNEGWICEIFIPYISLRFPEKVNSDWGMNMIRSVRRTRQQFSWNFLNKNLGYSFEYQCGILKGMKDIKPPVRLSFTPYVSAIANDFESETTYDLNAGLDLKYGINESFTLDMTLVPDFSQVSFDRQFLNLSPFENQFEENRQFFTEGTELFSIGDLFYSRRIGGAPQNITNASLNEEGFTVKQEFTRLLNATKVSGRTSKNLGIGVLNAVTDENFATRTDSLGREEQVLTEPFTNYNVLVLDQRFNRNSSVSFVNTNVLRDGNSPDANVAAVLTTLTDKEGKYRLDADIRNSNIFSENSTLTGYQGSLSIRDVSGNWRWRVRERITTKDYEINDLGFLRRNNRVEHFAEFSYLEFQPKGIYNRYEIGTYVNHLSLQQPNVYEDFEVGFNVFFLLRSFFAYGVNGTYRPAGSFDYFEPRVAGRKFYLPPRYNFGGFISSDYRKVVAIDARFGYGHRTEFNGDSYSYNVSPRIRFSDNFFAILNFNVSNTNNDFGWVDNTNDAKDSIYFGRRKLQTVENSVDARYVFNPTMTLTLSLRHFWSGVEYQDYRLLNQDGSLTPIEIQENFNINFNTINTDIKFSWWFAPGSEMVLLYRNILNQQEQGNTVTYNYLENLDATAQSPIQNNLSLRITYFLDYNYLKKAFK